ncbi:MAG: UDP-N-acetylmuramate dehydrogenase [Prevotellaceae bacterium]|jgi:UDP-N-acetylmuramate dehydrogenase|nr:UDP-N-acetylmuramate dehydrogenase [Prevotellaceae bacterium]
MQLYENFSLKAHNTFGIDAKARFFVEYDTEAELSELLRSELLRSHKLLSIGGGSNLLFTQDFDGVVLHSQLKGIELIDETENEVLVRAGAGVVWDDFVAHCVANSWYGAENLSNIPGEIGACAVQNIGAYGVEAKDIVSEVEGLDVATVEPRVLSNSECHFAYRDSVFKHELAGKFIVTSVLFRLSKQADFKLDYGSLREEIATYGEPSLHTVRQAVIAIRVAKLPDPKEQGNGGSFFKNPVISAEKFAELKKEYPDIPSYPLPAGEVKIPAAWLIEQCGWKGRSVGNAAVHSKQALVLINRNGQATGQEIVELSKQIRASVRSKFGVEISPEVIFL